MPHVHPLIYYAPAKADGRKTRVGFHVDVTAAWNVADALGRSGYTLGRMLFNYPPQEGAPREVMQIDTSRFKRGDMLLTPTRFETEPPGSPDACRKQTQRGYTDLEGLVVGHWRNRIATSRRLFLKLQPAYANRFAPSYENRFRIRFFEEEGAPYKHLANAEERQNDSNPPTASAAYLLRLRELYPGGPGYLGFFGLDSTTTLIWSHLLRHRHADLLHEEGFAIAEISGPIPVREPDLEFAEEWKSEIILHAKARLDPKKI
jgi:hypothetical protein